LIEIAVVGLGNDYRGDSRFPYLKYFQEMDLCRRKGRKREEKRERGKRKEERVKKEKGWGSICDREQYENNARNQLITLGEIPHYGIECLPGSMWCQCQPNEHTAAPAFSGNIFPTRSGHECLEPWVPCQPLRHPSPFDPHAAGYIDGLHCIAQTLISTLRAGPRCVK
jgi:hypothetical protein